MTRHDASTADVTWTTGQVPVSTRFDDPYYSLHDGLAETRHVFLSGNDLPARYRDGFHIGELGFGTGLNALAAWAAWQGEGTLHMTSFEAFPLDPDTMAAALTPWPELQDRAEALTAALRANPTQATLPGFSLTLILGDARETLPAWTGTADAWFLDGFSPAKNPELWEPSLLKAVHDHTAPQGTAATYSAARPVRDALTAAGFTVTRHKGFAHKRHMTRAVRP